VVVASRVFPGTYTKRANRLWYLSNAKFVGSHGKVKCEVIHNLLNVYLVCSGNISQWFSGFRRKWKWLFHLQWVSYRFSWSSWCTASTL